MNATPRVFRPVRLSPLHCEMFSIKMRSLENHAWRVERMPVEELAAGQKAAEKKMDSLPADRRQAYAEDCAEDLHVIGESGPKTLRAALFIFAFSEFEFFLNSLAEAARRQNKLPFSFRDLNGLGIRRAAHYLKKTGVKFPDKSKEWGDVLALSEIRNCLAHNGGELPSDEEKNLSLATAAARWKDDVAVDGFRRLELQSTFVPKTIECFQAFEVTVRPHLLA